MNSTYFFLVLLTLLLPSIPCFSDKTITKAPRLTIVIIIDQFAYHYLPKVHTHLTGGLGKIMSNGTFFTRAYYPHGIPETTPGHHTLSTATLPKDHGAVTNQWINPESYEKIAYVTSNPKKHPASHTQTDGISDQFLLHQDNYTAKLFAFSIKDYPAISMAQRLGKAIWFDMVKGSLTTDAHYYKKIPSWIKKYHADNYLQKKLTTKKSTDRMKYFAWPARYNSQHPAYAYPAIDWYDHAGLPFTLVNNSALPIDLTEEKPYELFAKTPGASQLLLDAALDCIDHEYDKKSRMLLWISLSNFDLAGHLYGPHSKELLDLLYHIDQQLETFFKKVQKKVSSTELLITLTGDHGIAPIPEVMHKLGYSGALRVNPQKLIERIHKKIYQAYPELKATQPLKAYEPTSFVIDQKIKKIITPDHYELFLRFVCRLLEQEPGIKKAWTQEQLHQYSFAGKNAQESFYRNQLYTGRIGEIIIQPAPYCQVTHYPTGTSHMTPYEYDTHVPLVFYWKDMITRKQVSERVLMTQFGITLAHLLGICLPSAATEKLLPGISVQQEPVSCKKIRT